MLKCVVKEEDVILGGRGFNAALLPAFCGSDEDTRPVLEEASMEPEFNAALLPRYIIRE